LAKPRFSAGRKQQLCNITITTLFCRKISTCHSPQRRSDRGPGPPMGGWQLHRLDLRRIRLALHGAANCTHTCLAQLSRFSRSCVVNSLWAGRSKPWCWGRADQWSVERCQCGCRGRCGGNSCRHGRGVSVMSSQCLFGSRFVGGGRGVWRIRG
jgi:hypothetical protein